MNDANLLFSTDFNYQKIALKGTATASVPSGIGETEVTINHNLGYKPSVRVWFDPQQGRRWMAGQDDFLDITTFVSQTAFCWCSYYVTNNTMVMRFRNQSGSTRTFTYYYRIYYDT